MARVHPINNNHHSTICNGSLQEREKYTVWLKSLVFNCNGCAIYDSNGKLVYRIDTYDNKRRRKVYLMDHEGSVMCTLTRKKLRLNECWEGYKCDQVENEKSWFQVKKSSKVFNKEAGFSCSVTMKGDKPQTYSSFKVQGLTKKSEFQIINDDGKMVAQVKRKEASKSVMLGEDVLSLEMVSHVDRSLIMALILVHGLMSHKI